MKWIYNKIVLLVIRWILAVVFIYAGIGKIINPNSFAQDIDNYQILPYLFVTVMAAILPWMEVICGLLLISGKWNLGASFIIAVLNLVFILAIFSALIRGLDISCGCFASYGARAKVGVPKLFEDLGWMTGAIIVFYNSSKERAIRI